MGWQDLLEERTTDITLPWVGGRELCASDRIWRIAGGLPAEHGWYCWTTRGRKAECGKAAAPDFDALSALQVKGYLVGDRVVPDGEARVDTDPQRIFHHSEKVWFIEPGLPRFARVLAGRLRPEGPLFYIGQDFPLGPEEDVLEAFLERRADVSEVKKLSPGLHAAFRMEAYQREQEEARRRELARLAQEEAERRAVEERRRRLMERLGDGQARRELARVDFAQAARAALLVGQAEYLDSRRHVRRGEWVVQYRVDGRRLECTCNEDLRIIDAGVCLTDHATGERYDDRLTLESLPTVVRYAAGLGRLHVWRHA